VSRYRVEISRRAVKAIARLERAGQLRIRAAIDLLADEPRPPGCVKLAGEASACRVRVGDYRIVYDVIDDRLVIQVVRVGHRRDIYRSP
jgi:mRNA interferase RelE/StbE